MRPDLYKRVKYLEGVASSAGKENKGKIELLLRTIANENMSLSVIEGHVRTLDASGDADLLGQRESAEVGNAYIERLLSDFEQSAVIGVQNSLSKG